MKKSLILLFPGILLASFTVFAQQLNISDIVRSDDVIRVQDLQPGGQEMHPAAARAVARGEKPGAFKNVSYELAPNVKMLSPARKNSIRLQQDGMLDISPGAFRPSPDSIYFDPSSDLVLSAWPADDKNMIAVRPSMASVFQNIEVPEQEVPLTLANTVSLAKGVVESSLQLNNKYAVNLKFDSVSFLIDKQEKDSLVITLVGQILLTNPRIEGKYSRNNGYRLVFLASEQVDMKIYTTMNYKREVKTPVWGTVINMSDLGKCEIGLFILVSAEGSVTLAVEVHQGLELALGASGGTFWYIPTSLTNISNVDSWCEVAYNIRSKMKAFAGFQCTANLKLKGYNALDVFVNAGMEGTVATDGWTLDADVGLRLKAGGKVISKKFTLLDSYYSLWKYQKPDFGNYSMIIHEACAWGDYVAGGIHSLVPGKNTGIMDTVPYAGPLTVIVSRKDGSGSEYSAVTGDGGVFIARNVPLRKGDRVSVKIPGVANASQPVDATLPFSEIKLYSADYFTGEARGSVAGSRSKWARLAASREGPVPAAVAAIAGTMPSGRLSDVLARQETLDRLNEFRNNLTVYRGPIEFAVTAAVSPAVTGTAAQSPAADNIQAQQGTASGTAAVSRIATGQAPADRIMGKTAAGTAAAVGKTTVAGTTTGAGTRAAAGTAATAGTRAGAAVAVKPGSMIEAQKGTVSSPLGYFSVGGLAFEPGQMVKASIEVEGFILESDWVETDGLSVSVIEHDEYRVSAVPGSETYSAANSFVVVSALRGGIAPEGSVYLLAGADAPHASLKAPQAVQEFPDAHKAKIWFSENPELIPLENHPGTAVASTGPWSVTYGYSAPGDAINPLKNRKHPFELIRYIYKGTDLGYSDYTDQCGVCTSPLNLLDRLQKNDIPGMTDQSGRSSVQTEKSVQTQKNIPAAKPQQQIKRPPAIR